MQHEFFAEQQHGRILELQEAVPFVDSRAPERHRERDAHHELSQRGLRDGSNESDQPIGKHADLTYRTAAGSKLISGSHFASPLSIAMNTPASIMPAILAGR